MSHLRSVNEEYPERDTDVVDDYDAVGSFEGQRVDYARARLTGVADLDVGDDTNRIDDVVRMYVEGRVTGVAHVVEPASGKLIRVHTIKAIEAIQLPAEFDPDDFRS